VVDEAKDNKERCSYVKKRVAKEVA